MTNTIINPEDDLPIDMSKSQPKLQISWQIIFTVSMFLFMYLPIFVLTFYSFNKSKYSSGWEGFTLQWYVKLFQDIRILVALQNSLTVAFFAVAIAAVIGTLMAVGLAKYKFRGKSLYLGISYLPLIVRDSSGRFQRIASEHTSGQDTVSDGGPHARNAEHARRNPERTKVRE